MKSICSFCGEVLREGSGTPDEPVSHGICSPCKNHFIARLGIDITLYLDMLDAPVILVDDNARILAMSDRARALVPAPAGGCEGELFGKVFECAWSLLPGGCGQTIHCSGCAIRMLVGEVFRTGEPVEGRPAVLNRHAGDAETEVYLTLSARKDNGAVLLKIGQAGTGAPPVQPMQSR